MSTVGETLRMLRERKPLVHNITNYVVMNETANALLALGALPVMAHAREASRVAAEAVAHGLTELGAGDGPVDVFHLDAAR